MTGKHFEDLTKIDCPFALLDDDTQKRLRSYKGAFEHFGIGGLWVGPKNNGPGWYPHQTYRAKPVPVTETTVHDMQISSHGKSIDPTISTGGQKGRGWVNGKLTVQTIDGAAVSATWEAYE